MLAYKFSCFYLNFGWHRNTPERLMIKSELLKEHLLRIASMHLLKLTVNSLDFMYFMLLRACYELNLYGLTITLSEHSKLITLL